MPHLSRAGGSLDVLLRQSGYGQHAYIELSFAKKHNGMSKAKICYKCAVECREAVLWGSFICAFHREIHIGGVAELQAALDSFAELCSYLREGPDLQSYIELHLGAGEAPLWLRLSKKEVSEAQAIFAAHVLGKLRGPRNMKGEYHPGLVGWRVACSAGGLVVVEQKCLDTGECIISCKRSGSRREVTAMRWSRWDFG